MENNYNKRDSVSIDLVNRSMETVRTLQELNSSEEEFLPKYSNQTRMNGSLVQYSNAVNGMVMNNKGNSSLLRGTYTSSRSLAPLNTGNQFHQFGGIEIYTG